LVDSFFKGMVIVLVGPSFILLKSISKLFAGTIESVNLSFELGVGVVLHCHHIFVFFEGNSEFSLKNILLLLDQWAKVWVGSELLGILGNLHQLDVDSMGLGAGHTDRPESQGFRIPLPVVTSISKGSIVVFEIPSVLVSELITESISAYN
jgi:hypothetical protein